MQLFIDDVEIFPEHGFFLRKGLLNKIYKDTENCKHLDVSFIA